MNNSIREVFPMGFPWRTADPFLFCVHHLDHYPEGNADMSPSASLDGRRIGMDFDGKDGWSMYHGSTVPGFPRHPHSGFETVTIARQGYIDHSDSLGARARFGKGDVQWMTAGSGVVHSEMFPLVNDDAPNPTELFQIWLNLPREDKSKDAYFTMFWNDQVPELEFESAGGSTAVRVIAGSLGGSEAPQPPPSSWASRDESAIAIWSIEMEEGAKWTLPAGPEGANRTLYFFSGRTARVDDREVQVGHGITLDPTAEVEVACPEEAGEFLLLQGRPIGEPVVQQGPFVANYPGEIRQVMIDYQRTGFGGWPWESDGPVHPRESGRFAVHVDGRREEPG